MNNHPPGKLGAFVSYGGTLIKNKHVLLDPWRSNNRTFQSQIKCVHFPSFPSDSPFLFHHDFSIFRRILSHPEDVKRVGNNNKGERREVMSLVPVRAIVASRKRVWTLWVDGTHQSPFVRVFAFRMSSIRSSRRFCRRCAPSPTRGSTCRPGRGSTSRSMRRG